MFGRHNFLSNAANRLKARQKLPTQSRSDLRKEKKHKENQVLQAESSAVKSAEDRKRGREEGRKYAEELFSRDMPGLQPEKRQAMQYEANKQIQRGHQAANRKLLGEQSQHGIVGKGGVGYAQQRDLQRLANEAQGQANRDLTKLDSDLALKKLAATFNIEQGEAAQGQMDKQLALDELRYEDEKKRQRAFEKQFHRQFTRV